MTATDRAAHRGFDGSLRRTAGHAVGSSGRRATNAIAAIAPDAAARQHGRRAGANTVT